MTMGIDAPGKIDVTRPGEPGVISGEGLQTQAPVSEVR